ncbi:PAS domain-containing protein [Algoriphagus terrigena]|uniref:PAS domain-containing protein n=1 Tax=Algoriphagus terrigena TaxID=344884 RepID=UPI00041C67A8|nr:PAS domain S-box protein [Algoriphagus terrigena]
MSRLFSINNPKAICLTYLVVGVAWIFFSDQAAGYIFTDNIRGMSRFQLYKGFFYVIVTCLMLYFLIRKLADNLTRRKLELELVFSNPNLGILKFDAEGIFTQVSSNVLTMTGYSADEMIGKMINHYTPEHRRPQDDIALETIAKATKLGDFVFNKHVRTKSGEEIIVRGYGMRIKASNNEGSGYIVAFQNITEEIRYLTALEAYNAQLKELASEQSHLVRAPLARIMAISSLLQDPENLNPKEKLDLIQNLEVSADELDHALRDISQKMNTNPA